MSLVGKKILCIGGNGYIGNYFASRLVKQNAIVSVISRKGPKYQYPENKSIKWITGSILQPEMLKKDINQAQIIVHTIGTLIDSSILKGTKIGGPGTYEQINRDSLLSLLSNVQIKKKIIYLSSNGHPPFISRYITTKHEAQKKLLNSPNQGYILRPGFVYSFEHRKWSVPLRYMIDIWNNIYPIFQKITPQSKIKQILKQFKQGPNTSLQQMGDALIHICESGYNKSIIQNMDMHQISTKRNQYRNK